jgi:hypothetical protein
MSEHKHEEIKQDEKPKQSKDEAPVKDEFAEAIKEEFSRSYPASRDIEVVEVHNLATSLYVVELSYTPTGGIPSQTELLAFVEGDKCFIFGSR